MSRPELLSRRSTLLGLGLVLAPALPAMAQEAVGVTDPVATAKAVLEKLETDGAQPCVTEVMRLLNKKQTDNAELTNNLRPFSKKKPDLSGLAYDRNYNDLIRVLVFYSKYDDDRFPFMYFQFTFKRGKTNWTMTNLRFESEAAHAFPEGYVAP